MIGNPIYYRFKGDNLIIINNTGILGLSPFLSMVTWWELGIWEDWTLSFVPLIPYIKVFTQKVLKSLLDLYAYLPTIGVL